MVRSGWSSGTRVVMSMNASMLTCGSCSPRIPTTSLRDGSTVSGALSHRKSRRPPKWAFFSSLLVTLIRELYPATEQRVDQREVDRGQDHADAPPHQSHRKPVWRCGCIHDRQAPGGIDCRQNVRVDNKGSTGQHAKKIGARAGQPENRALAPGQPAHA